MHRNFFMSWIFGSLLLALLCVMMTACGSDAPAAEPAPVCGMYVHGDSGVIYQVPYTAFPVVKGWMYGQNMGGGDYWLYKADGSMLWVKIDGFGCE